MSRRLCRLVCAPEPDEPEDDDLDGDENEAFDPDDDRDPPFDEPPDPYFADLACDRYERDLDARASQ